MVVEDIQQRYGDWRCIRGLEGSMYRSNIYIYKGKGERRGCGNYRVIAILSIAEKLYGKALISKVM